ncbi:hypothetical protein [Allosphingosinicella indica]|uniref:hypothetical protein n=1 Tax=Allosphingosinicella indica TaxID=941907 RepID=UPI001FCD1BF4|nr:hypothetical protein [Allosphingosinicella indica]
MSGVAGEHCERRIEAAAPVPYPLAGDIAIDGVRLSDEPWAAQDLAQSYDFATGELTSRFAFGAGDRRATVEILTFASRSHAPLVLQEVALTVDAPCRIELVAAVDPKAARGIIRERRTGTPGEKSAVCDGSLHWESHGALSRCGIALLSTLDGTEADRSVADWDARGPLQTRYGADARPGRPLRLRQIAALIPSIVHDRPHEEAVRRVAEAGRLGFDLLRARNREAWLELWKSRIMVDGASVQHQALIDAGFFYLNSSVHPASPAATSIFGLASWPDYHYYYGHVMWDIDAFCVPPLTLLQPEAARGLMSFRIRTLDVARRKARLEGRRGVQFPWQSGPASGDESAPGGGDAAATEDHVTLHVARAASMLADSVPDLRYLREKAWPILAGAADWAVSRLTRTERGYELCRAMGPAEVPVPPNNDAFTLMAMHDVLRRAIDAAARLGGPCPPDWQKALAGLYLPRRSDGAIASHDDFRIDEDKGTTPSPLAGLFPLEYPLSQEERTATLALFLPRWRAYVGSPMLPALYPIWAAMAGDRRLALQLFEEGYAAYDHGRFHQCLEYRPDFPDSEVPAGPFFANIGGMLTGLLYGFSGMTIDGGAPDRWPRRPIILPEGWRSIEVERLWVRGRPMRLVARHGAERAELAET